MTLLRKVLAAVGGFVAGSAVNMGLVVTGGEVFPPPAGLDMSTAEGLKAAMPLLQTEHFVFPLLAHAAGTFVGALVATWLTPGRTPGPAWAVGALFLLAGIAMAATMPGPLWFEATDVVLAYLPMAWLGHRVVARGRAPVPAAA
jgi:hypothetical protein